MSEQNTVLRSGERLREERWRREELVLFHFCSIFSYLDWDSRCCFPWFSAFGLKLELHHGVSLFSSGQKVDCGTSQPPESHEPIPHNLFIHHVKYTKRPKALQTLKRNPLYNYRLKSNQRMLDDKTLSSSTIFL